MDSFEISFIKIIPKSNIRLSGSACTIKTLAQNTITIEPMFSGMPILNLADE